MIETKQHVRKIEGNQYALPIIERAGRRFVVTILTDLDGTVNDESVRESERMTTVGPAKDAIAEFESRHIPVGIITNMSFGEAVLYKKELNSHGPIICEEGAVIVLPEPYSKESLARARAIPEAHQLLTREGKDVIVLSEVTQDKLAEFLSFIQEKLSKWNFFPDKQIISTLSSTPEEIKQRIDHRMDLIASAYVVLTSQDEISTIRAYAKYWGIRTSGIPIHLIGEDADKRHALQLINKYANIFFPRQREKIDGIIPIIFSNNTNDLRLTEETHKMGGTTVIVGKPGDGHFVPETDIPTSVIKTKETYGKGMLEAVPEIFSRLSQTYNIV